MRDPPEPGDLPSPRPPKSLRSGCRSRKPQRGEDAGGGRPNGTRPTYPRLQGDYSEGPEPSYTASPNVAVRELQAPSLNDPVGGIGFILRHELRMTDPERQGLGTSRSVPWDRCADAVPGLKRPPRLRLQMGPAHDYPDDAPKRHLGVAAVAYEESNPDRRSFRPVTGDVASIASPNAPRGVGQGGRCP